LSTGSGAAVEPAGLLKIGNAAADCLARAIMRATVAAEPLGGFTSWRLRWGEGQETVSASSVLRDEV
jgi:hypothetical protein